MFPQNKNANPPKKYAGQLLCRGYAALADVGKKFKKSQSASALPTQKASLKCRFTSMPIVPLTGKLDQPIGGPQGRRDHRTAAISFTTMIGKYLRRLCENSKPSPRPRTLFSMYVRDRRVWNVADGNGNLIFGHCVILGLCRRWTAAEDMGREIQFRERAGHTDP